MDLSAIYMGQLSKSLDVLGASPRGKHKKKLVRKYFLSRRICNLPVLAPFPIYSEYCP
jgi:hypothetical protein